MNANKYLEGSTNSTYKTGDNNIHQQAGQPRNAYTSDVANRRNMALSHGPAATYKGPVFSN
jgi:hypothetical protein